MGIRPLPVRLKKAVAQPSGVAQQLAQADARLDFSQLTALTFEDADAQRFPGLHLSWQALRAIEGTTTVLNAANEMAVDAFLHRRLTFDRIHAVNLETLAKMQLPQAPGSLEDLLAVDAQARDCARAAVERWALA